MAAPKGNKFASKEHRAWSEAIKRAVARLGDGKQDRGLNRLADALLQKVMDGDMSAIREFGDRYDGKVPQAIEGTGQGGAIILTVTVDDRSIL